MICALAAPTTSYLPQDLPRSLQEICEVVGFDAIQSLIQEFGGRRIYVPQSPSKYHSLVKFIGHDNLLALSSLCSGESIELPHLSTLLARARRREIRKLSLTATIAQLTRLYALPRTTIGRIVRRA
jgi:Mor family transcriptional regulator